MTSKVKIELRSLERIKIKALLYALLNIDMVACVFQTEKGED